KIFTNKLTRPGNKIWRGLAITHLEHFEHPRIRNRCGNKPVFGCQANAFANESLKPQSCISRRVESQICRCMKRRRKQKNKNGFTRAHTFPGKVKLGSRRSLASVLCAEALQNCRSAIAAADKAWQKSNQAQLRPDHQPTRCPGERFPAS